MLWLFCCLVVISVVTHTFACLCCLCCFGWVLGRVWFTLVVCVGGWGVFCLVVYLLVVLVGVV